MVAVTTESPLAWFLFRVGILGFVIGLQGVRPTSDSQVPSPGVPRPQPRRFPASPARPTTSVRIVSMGGNDKCPVCRQEIRDSEISAECEKCGLAHHPECWDYARKCSRYGCGSRTSLTTTRS
jgi:hypothetical protein